MRVEDNRQDDSNKNAARGSMTGVGGSTNSVGNGVGGNENSVGNGVGGSTNSVGNGAHDLKPNGADDLRQSGAHDSTNGVNGLGAMTQSECKINNFSCNGCSRNAIASRYMSNLREKIRAGDNTTAGAVDKHPTAPVSAPRALSTFQATNKTLQKFLKSFTSLKCLLDQKTENQKELERIERETKPYELVNFFFKNEIDNLELGELRCIYEDLDVEMRDGEYAFKRDMIKRRIRGIFAKKFREWLYVNSQAKNCSGAVSGEITGFMKYFTSREKYFMMVKYLHVRKERLGFMASKSMFLVMEMVRQEMDLFFGVFGKLDERINERSFNENGFNERSVEECEMGVRMGVSGDGESAAGDSGRLEEANRSGENEGPVVTDISHPVEANKAGEGRGPTAGDSGCLKEVVSSTESVRESEEVDKPRKIDFYDFKDTHESIYPFVEGIMKSSVLRVLNAFVFSLLKRTLGDFTTREIRGRMKSTEMKIREVITERDAVFYGRVVLWVSLYEYLEAEMERMGQFEL